MKKEGLIGMAAALALVTACKDDTERITLANCESGPKAGIYERTIPNDHLVKFVNFQTLEPENDIVTFPNHETNIIRSTTKNNRTFDIHIEPISPTESTLRVGIECKDIPSSK